jgi:predicted AAA+ superfamily ATPase
MKRYAMIYFNENAPEYHIVAAGSFLGVATGKFPVGQVDRLTIYPMSFYEFLEAIGRKQLVDVLQGLDPNMIYLIIIKATFQSISEQLTFLKFVCCGIPYLSI